jgi:CubicO group peptidase (beta-lactamase class C family)
VLVHQGKINVDEDVRKYLPELPDYGNVIQIKHLMTHTSGIRNYNVLLDLQGFDYDHTGYTNEDMEQLIFRQQGVNHAPGAKMLYSNSNYVLLALIVKRVSGKPIADFAKEELFEPLGLENTFFRSSIFEIVNNPASTYYFRNDEMIEHRSLTLCVGAGGMLSTVFDLLQWSTIYFDDQHPMAWLGSFLVAQDSLNDGTELNYGRGVFIDEYQGLTTIRHGGRGMGLKTHLLTVPELKLSIVVLVNTERLDAFETIYRILDQFITPVEKDALETEESNVVAKNPAEFIGDYQELNSDMGMKIFVENDTVKAKSSMGRFAVPLAKVSANVYQRWDNPSVRHTFYDDLEWDMTVDFGGANFYFEKVKLVDPATVNIAEFEGNFYSRELGVTYGAVVEGGMLTMLVPNSAPIRLSPTRKDEFGSGRRTRYTFFRNTNGEIAGLQVASEGTVKDIKFTLVQESESL